MYACSPSIVPPAFATQFNQNPFNFDNANSATAGASNDQEDQGPSSQVASANHIVPASTTNQAFANANQLIEQAEEFSLSPQNLVDPNHKAGKYTGAHIIFDSKVVKSLQRPCNFAVFFTFFGANFERF